MVSPLSITPKGEFKRLKGQGPNMEVSSKILSRKILYGLSPNTLSSNFTIEDGHCQFLTCTSSALVSGGTLYPQVDCWRIKKMKFYLINNEHSERVRLVFTPRGYDTQNFLSDIDAGHIMVSQSDSIPSVFEYIPKPFHPIGMWHKTTTDNPTGNIFLLDCNSNMDANSMIEIEYQYILNCTGAPHGYSVLSTSPTVVGTLYQGQWGASNSVTPIGINAVTIR